MKQLNIILAVLLLLCLFKMPYGYYTLMRLAATVGFAYMAYRYYEMKKETLVWTFGALALLFQPLVKIALGRDVWNIVDAEVAPDAIVVKGNGNITLNGEGNIGGLTSMNKAGEGTLAINTTNKYSGATVLHEGTIEFNSLKNGGEASAIGSSKE